METAIVPPFDIAITEQEWLANNEARRAQHEAEASKLLNDTCTNDTCANDTGISTAD